MRRTFWLCFFLASIYSAPWKFGELSICAYAESPANPAVAEATKKAEEGYHKTAEEFMNGNAEDAFKDAGEALLLGRFLKPDERLNLAFMRTEAMRIRPRWWDQTKSSTPISFRASMWDQTFPANYKPSSELGLQAPVAYDSRTNRLVIVVTWRPAMVDNPKPITGWLAKRIGMTQADLGEVIVWHELGHNYVSLHLPAEQVLELYQNYQDLYMDVQEFYADLTALRHASPRAARMSMIFRLDTLYRNDDSEPHNRGATRGVGALILSEFLSHPDKWPSVHFPPKVPENNVEVNTIKYVYEHFDPKWSIDEYKLLHDFIDVWVRRNGDAVLRRKGLVRLPNGLEYHVMATDDRDDQVKRDNWIADRLKELIASGRADKPSAAQNQDQDQGGIFTGINLPL